MRNLFPVLLTCLLLVACVEAGPKFEHMSELELAAYNNTKPIAQMIVCTDESRSFSRVRRYRCMTVEKMYGSAEQAAQLNVLNSVQGYSDGGNF